MSKLIDQTYLLKDQYRDASNLDARVTVHLLFSTNKYGWHCWCFDHYLLPAQAQQRRADLQHFIEKELARQGVIHISIESGMFIGVKP